MNTMKFKQYLNEGRTQSIKGDKAVELILKNCNKHFKSIYMTGKTMPIYRGLLIGVDYGYINSNKGRLRTSANTFNYMTLLMDNLPSYKKYPKRSKSLICSTDSDDAKNFGDIHHVIPYDNNNIAVASSSDIWDSFPNMFNKYQSVSDFNDYLNSMFRDFDIKDPTTWSELKNSLIELNKKYDKEKDNEKDYADYIFKSALFDPKRDIMKYLNTQLSPTKNGMRLGINNLQKDREVWIQGETIIISEYRIDDIIKGVIDEI